MDPRLIFSAMAAAVALWAVLQYLYWRTDQPFLLLWALGSALWVVRYLLQGLAGAIGVPLPEAVIALLGLARVVLFSNGAMWATGRGPPKWTWPVVVLCGAWTLLAAGRLDPVSALAPAYLVFGAGFAAAGVVFGRDAEFPAFDRRLLAGALVAYGVVNAPYPLGQVIPGLAPFGVASTAALQIVMAVGIIQAFFRRSLEEIRVVAGREELALTRALSDFVTICSYCRDIREDEGAWMPLDDYVVVHTDADLQPLLCPKCANG